MWPENFDAVLLFVELATQWRPERCGMDYLPLFARLDRLADSKETWERLYAQVRVLEGEALAVMAEERKLRQQRNE